MKIIDLSMDISAGMIVFPGDPGVTLDLINHFSKDLCQVTELCFGSHTGTHVDAPRHFLPEGSTIVDLPLASFVGEAICLKPEISSGLGQDHPVMNLSEEQKSLIRENDRILFSTGWDKYAGTSAYFQGYPVFSESLTGFLLKKRPILIGADLPTLENQGDPFWMHREMFAGNTVFAEGLINLTQLEGKRFFFSAAPLKLAQGDGSPVRAYGIVEEDN